MPSLPIIEQVRGHLLLTVSAVLLLSGAVIGFSACAGTRSPGQEPPEQAPPGDPAYRIETRRVTQPGREPGNTEGHFGKQIAYPFLVGTPDRALETKINTLIRTFIGLDDLIARDRSVEVTYELLAAPGHTLQFHFTFFLEGGAHPFTVEKAIALDLKSGRRYALTDLLQSSGLAPLQRWAAQALKDYYQVGSLEDFQLDADPNFAFDDTHLYLYFSDCEVVSCAAGPAIITISLAKLKPHIAPAGPLAFFLKSE